MGYIKYLYRRYLGWLPIQFCMVCGKPYWGGFPEFHIDADTIMRHESKWTGWPRSGKRWTCVWMPWWQDYCSKKCANKDREED